jgi:hypothetical protein
MGARIFAVLFVGCLMTGTSYSTEYTKDPAETFAQALDKLPGGGTLYLSGPITEYEQKIKVSGRRYTEQSPLIIDGQWKTESHQPIDFSDCAWVTVKSMLAYGGLGWNNNTPDYEKCAQNIVLEDMIFRYGRLFSGGYTFHHLTMKNCLVQEVIYTGNETHEVYKSGGHWIAGAGAPHPHHILIENCNFRTAGGRHAIQVNGCFEDVTIRHCTFAGCCLTGFQGIGVKRCLVEWCQYVFCNRGDVNLFDYNDNLPASGTASRGYLEAWRQVHHPNDEWEIRNCTFFVGPHEWYDWQNPSSVKNRPGILLNNELAMPYYQDYRDSDGVWFDLDYKPTAHWIHHNLFVSPWPNMIEFHDPWSLNVTHVTDNMFWTYDENVPPLVTAATDAVPPGAPTAVSIKQMEEWWPNQYKNNITDVDPKIKLSPEGPHASEIPPMNKQYPPNASFDWSKWEMGGMQPNDVVYPPAKWNLFSGPAAKRGIGAFKKGIWTQPGGWQPARPIPNPIAGRNGFKPETPDHPRPVDPTTGKRLKLTRDEFRDIINKRKLKTNK